MRKTLRGKLTYANVVSTVCLFLLLGGASAFAATQLAKNSVGAKQLKKNAVTTAKIKNGAVTGAKIKLSSLGTVSSATHAGTADSAIHASSADSASTLTPPEAVHYVGAPGEPPLEAEFETPAPDLGFYKDRQCVVHLVGQVEGPSGAAAFFLPPADRPPKEVFEGIAAGGPIPANIEIETNGEVRPFASGGELIKGYGLEGVTFRAASC